MKNLGQQIAELKAENEELKAGFANYQDWGTYSHLRSALNWYCEQTQYHVQYDHKQHVWYVFQNNVKTQKFRPFGSALSAITAAFRHAEKETEK